MSSTLYWKPVIPERGRDLSYETKRVISRYIWDTDGSIGGSPARLTEGNIEFLRGMELAGSENIRKDMKILIDAINEYGVIELWHEH